MGLISAGLALLSRVGGAVATTGGRVLPANVARFGRPLAGLGAAAAGGAAFQGGLNLLDGGGGGGGAPSGGGGFVTAPDGSRVLLSSTGRPVRPQFFLPMGARMPAGSRVVAVSPSGNLIGIRRRAKRRTFASEISRSRLVITNCKRLLKAVK